MITVCPPALKCLVYLWEQLCSNCVEIVQSNASITASNPFSGNYDVHKDHSSPVQLSKADDIVNGVVSAGIRINHDFKKSKKKKKGNYLYIAVVLVHSLLVILNFSFFFFFFCGKFGVL